MSASPDSPRPGFRLPSFLMSYFVILLALLYLPLGILLLFSVNDNTTLVFPLHGFTARWYNSALDTPAAIDAVRNSVIVASGSSVVATTLATMLAILATRYRFWGKSLLLGLAMMPLVVPYLVLGVALLLLFAAFDIERSLLTIGIAHSVIAIPYALLIIASRLASTSHTLEEAAMDLGSTYPTTLRRIILPLIFPSVVAGWLVAFTASFDEFALALFLAGTEPTLPVYIYGQLRFASRLPMLIALVMLVMLGTLALAFLAERLRRI
jgi:spermidine/putrescine transport system permease protein